MLAQPASSAAEKRAANVARVRAGRWVSMKASSPCCSCGRFAGRVRDRSSRLAQIVEYAIEQRLQLRAFLFGAVVQRAFRHTLAASIDAFPEAAAGCGEFNAQHAAIVGIGHATHIVPLLQLVQQASHRAGVVAQQPRQLAGGHRPVRAEPLQGHELAETEFEALTGKFSLDAGVQFRADAADQAAQLERRGSGGLAGHAAQYIAAAIVVKATVVKATLLPDCKCLPAWSVTWP